MARHRYSPGSIPTRVWLLIVTAIALLERVLLYLSYRPAIYSDTLSYRRLAGQILEGWERYDGSRMPGYPLFLYWLGGDETVYAVQLVLGLAITLLFFYIGWQISGRGWFAALAAAAYTLNPQQVLVEADLLSETLTIFLLAGCLACLAWLFKSGNERKSWQVLIAALLIGAVAGLAALTRSLFVFLPFLAAFLLLVVWRVHPVLRWTAALATALTGLLLVALWVNFIHRQFGMWALDAIGGYHLMNHVGPFFHYLPDEYAVIRDTFIEYQSVQLAETGHTGNAIWDAIPALQEASGLGFYGLSAELSHLAVGLILDHPLLYLQNVAQGWLAYWKAPVHWAGGPSVLLRGLRGLLVGINLAFLTGSTALLFGAFRRRMRMDATLWLLTGTVWAASLLQALVEFGDNPRYSIPVQTLVLLVVLWWVISMVRKNETASA